MKRIKHSILILLTLLSISKAVGQNYPVQSFVQISQPYSSYLPDYADPFNNQLKILLTLTDFTVPSHQVKIKIHLNGNGYSIETKDNLNLPPIILTPGAPVEISGSDLAPYLATENLNFSGIDVNNYLQTKVLPEGPCQICVDIIDFTSPSGTLLGNPACAQAWFERLQPPFANTPFCGDTISTNNPQVVLFNWTPVTSNSPSTFTTEYVFELYENTAGIEIDPNVLVTTTLPVSIITTPNAFINFGITDYQLQVGKQYVWRVQARNTEGRDLYVNNGYSAVCSFVYGSLIESLTNGIELELQTNGTGTRQGNAIWNANSVFDNYVLEVRKTGNSDFEWFPYTTEFGVPISNMKINGLEPETEYEARIKGLIGNEFESDYSNVSVFTTNPTPNYQCGSEAMPATSPNITPLQVATYGMFFTIGQFEMMVTHIEPLVGQAGHYKGLGQITMPFLLTKLNVSYQDILVDDNLMVREGKVEAITQGIDAWEHDQLIDLATPHYTPEVDTSLITMAVDSSGILVTFTGVDSTFEFEGNGIPIVLNAEGGIQYIIWPDGSIELGTWGNVSTEDFDATKDYYVNFEATPNQAYGFDDYNSDFSAWAGNYENIFLSDNTNYYVSYKSTAWNIGDHVLAKLHTDSTALDLTFTIDGDELDANHVNKINDSTYNLNLDGYMETYSENVYAFDSYGRKIGKLRVIPYENKNIQVYIVPVGSAQINQPNLEAELNNIYKVANTHFDVTIEPTFNNTVWDLNNDGKIEVTDPQLLATYSGEMRKLRQQYFDSSNVERDKEALYIFVVDQFDDPNQDGYMVKGKSFGFVKNNPSVKTIAHEIGHGAFKLEHTFPTITQNTTNNLLDYSSGTELLKPQWEQIFNTQITFSFLDDEEDGGMATTANIEFLDVYRNKDGYLSFMTPAGKPIMIKENIEELSFVTAEDSWENSDLDIPIGTLVKFKINGIIYKAQKTVNADQFYGYSSDEGGSYYIDNLSKNYEYYNKDDENYTKVLIGIPCIKNGTPVFTIYPSLLYEIFGLPVLPTFENDYKGSGPISYQTLNGSGLLDPNDSKVIPAVLSRELTEKEKQFFSYFNQFEDICGESAVFAFATANLLNENDVLMSCFSEFENEAGHNAYLIDSFEDQGAILMNYTQADNTTVSPVQNYSNLNTNTQESNTLSFYKGLYQSISYMIDQALPFIEEQNVLSNFSLPLFANILESLPIDQRTCVIKNFSFENRIELLKKYKTWGGLTQAKERLLVDLIRFTPKTEWPLMLAELKGVDNEFNLYWDLYDDINSSLSDVFVTYVSVMVLDQNPIPAELGNWPQNREIETNFVDIFKSNFYQYNRSGANVALGWVYSDGQLNEPHTYQGNPFELVRVKIKENFQFSNINGEKLEAGEEYVVPALWAYWILDRQNTIGNWTAVRVIANAAAAVLTVATGGTPWFIAVELAFNVADASLALYEDDYLSGNLSGYEDLYSNLQAVVTLGDFAFISFSGVNAIYKWSFKRTGLVNDIKQLKNNDIEFNNFKSKIKNIYTSIKKMVNGEITGNITFLKAYFKQVVKELDLHTVGHYLDDATDVELKVAQGDFVFVKTNATSGISIGKVDDNIVLNDLRWQADFHNPTIDGELNRVVFEFNDASYKLSPGGTTNVGDLEVVESATTKKLFVRLKVAEAGGNSFFKNINEFALTFKNAENLTPAIKQQAYDFYNAKNWSALENLFTSNNIKTGGIVRPPANGGYNIVDNVPITAGQKFDRYGNAFGNTPNGNPNLGGSFTSPINNNTPYNFGQRALNGTENTYDFYYEIEVLQDLSFTAQNADVIPWFGKPGGAKQSMWDIPANPNSPQGYSYTLSELAEMGMIKITIKESPSGNFNNLVNTVIEQ